MNEKQMGFADGMLQEEFGKAVKFLENVQKKIMVGGVRAMFECNAVMPDPSSAGTEHALQVVYMHAAYGSNGENADFSKFTPFGNLVMGISLGTPAANSGFFKQGKKYYLTFNEIPE